uniref:Selenoprotein W-related protein n=2 Tax=Kalmanozyma brasiliensis (strain GHG001) TaxID=1365824 RepID=V5EZ74_KALBG
MPTPLVVLEYCQRCKFGLRANWIQQELLSTFAPIPPAQQANSNSASIASVLLIPKVDDASSGRFRVWIHASSNQGSGLQLVWDRKVQAGFPEMKVLKQKIRDHVNPDFGLGHSDKK